MATKLIGVVENVVYSNSDTLFSVLEIDAGGDLVTVVGELAGTAVGEELVLFGDFTTHPVYGVQFKAEAAERTLPSGASAIFRYLSSGVVKGVGPVLARRLVDAFGGETLEILANDPEKLTGIRGFSQAKAEEVSGRFRQIHGLRGELAGLAELRLDLRDAIKLYRVFGPGVSDVIKDNPYMLCGYPLYKDFDAADLIADEQGFGPYNINRVRAGFVFVLRHNMNGGHTCLPAERLIDKTAEYLGIDRDEAETALWGAVESSLLSYDVINGKDYIFLPQLLRGENFIAERLVLLNSLEYVSASDALELFDLFQKREGIEYEDIQRGAILESLTSGALVITGGPGTGKTTALNAVISLCEQQGDKVALVAPTGRAAKRLSGLTRREASTIHRLLEVEFGSKEELRFVHNEHNLLDCDVVVVDEMSMVDVLLFESLLRGLRPQCRLIMVGDSNQLPAVGAGNLLRDIIDSSCCKVVEFRKVFRQAADSRIVVGAHSIIAGEMPDMKRKDGDFFFMECPAYGGHRLIADLVGNRLPDSRGADPFADIQVLSPQRKGLMGTESLNEALRLRLNPPSADKKETAVFGQLFREGDRVMQIKNNYDVRYRRADGSFGVGVFNGDIGRISQIVPSAGLLVVEFDDDRTVEYGPEAARELELAYAVTVHKSQGSEFPVVVVALSGVAGRLRYKNLLYTAVTRAKELLILVGDENVVSDMVKNDRQSLRYTALKTFIERLLSHRG